MSTTLDIAAVSVSLLSLTLYHLYAYGSVCFSNCSVRIPCIQPSMQLSRNLKTSSLWLSKHLIHDDASSDTAAIQTLRNAILVAIFIGGSSLTLAWNALDAAAAPDISFNDYMRLMILGVLLSASFLNWANTIRYATHLGFVVGTLKSAHSEIIKAKARREAHLISRTIVIDGHDMETGVVADEAKVARNELQSGACGYSSPPQELALPPRSPLPPAPAETPSNSISSTIFTSQSRDEEDPDYLERSFVKNQQMLECMLWGSSLGFRFIFAAIPFQFYAAGPVALLLATAVILGFLIHLDHGIVNLSQTLTYPSKKASTLTQ